MSIPAQKIGRAVTLVGVGAQGREFDKRKASSAAGECRKYVLSGKFP